MIAVPKPPYDVQKKIVNELTEARHSLLLSQSKLHNLKGTFSFVSEYTKNHKSNSEIDRLYQVYFKSLSLNYFKK